MAAETPEEPGDVPQQLGKGSELYRNLGTEPRPKELPVYVPSLAEQIERGDFTGSLVWEPSSEPNLDKYIQPDAQTFTASEKDAVEGLQTFLQEYIWSVNRAGAQGDAQLLTQASDMLENLTYVGSREMDQATSDIATDWKDYLDANSEAALYLWTRNHKSSSYVLDKTLAWFSDEDLEKYRGRLHFATELTKANAPVPPEHRKIVMLDDWIASGRQLAQYYHQDIITSDYGNDTPVEVQLIAAADDTIQNGLNTLTEFHPEPLPVKSVYRARPTVMGPPVITGLHSSTDDNFELIIGNMVKNRRQQLDQPHAWMPPLTNIRRTYRDSDYVPENVARMAEAYDEIPAFN